MESDTSAERCSRSHRIKEDKTGRLAALQKLKSLKGTKNKYEITEEAPLYEEVTEKEYSLLVQQRQEEDWIVDDNGSGYVDDGREIFDDDIEEDIYTNKKNKQPPKKNFAGPQKKTKSNDIKNLFKSIPIKRKIEIDVKLDDDDLLGSIMEDLHKESVTHAPPKPMVLTKKHKLNHYSPVQRYQINPFTKNKSPLATDFVPKDTSGGNLRSSGFNKKLMHPKIVDFNSVAEEVSKIKDVAETHSEEIEIKDKDIEEDDDFQFDPSGDIFDEVQTQSQIIEESTPLSSAEETTVPVLPFQSSFNSINKENVIVDIQVDSEHLPLVTNIDGNQVLRFFWLDAYEDQYKQPGNVYFFGKIYLEDSKAYTSCCIIVKDIPRHVFFLPRETHYDIKTKTSTNKPVTMQDVYTEVNTLMDKMKISEFKSKKSLKNYAFGSSEVPNVCEYLEVHYSAKFSPLPSDLSGCTFSHVLGVDSTSLEILLLEQKIKGPCWIDVHYPQLSLPPVTWCKIEAFVTKAKNIICTNESLPTPPIVLMCMNMTTVLNSKTLQNEVISISCLSHHQFPLDKTAPSPKYQSHFCVLTKPSDGIFPYDFKQVIMKYNNTKVERVDSERSLLIYFLAKIQKMDPDVIVGHDVLGFDLDVLLHRLSVHKIPNWSRIGRLKRAGMPRLNIAQAGIAEKNATCGRLLCDVKISSKELIRCKTYNLEELSSHLLNQQFHEIPSECIRSQYMSSTQLIELIDFSMRRAELILNLNCELNILPLALQITNIAGCIMSRTLLGGRSERNEYLLLHAFHAKNFICPRKIQGKKVNKTQMDGDDDLEIVGKKGRRKPAYEGGLVLDPKKGFYDKFILLMDFNSLYPSIIQEYNICFTTIPRISDSESKDEIHVSLPDPGMEIGILPAEIRKLVESRRQVKQIMKSNDITKDRYAQYDIRQRALKLTANSMYGCLGFTFSRFYAKPLAALITRKGREILMKTKDLVENMGLDVIYGDTDSIMINTNQIEFNEVTQLGNKVKAEINKLYRLLEIDIDGVYKPMLLLKKKKYAALSVSKTADGKIQTKEEIKGLDIVRRDWCQLAKNAGQFIIKEILSNKSKDEIIENIHSHLMNLGTAVREGRKPLSDYIIYKQLTKNPEEYGNKKNLPHVMVASRINDKGGKKLKMGDTVSYIICTDGTDQAATQRGYHPDELKSQEDLKIDVSYYLAQQIHPVVSRLCEPIDGTDAVMIADFLGLDSSKYHVKVQEAEEEEDKLLNPSSLLDDKDRFRNCDKLKLKCPVAKCGNEIIIEDILKIEQSSLMCQFDIEVCLKCQSKMVNYSASLSNQLQKIMKQYINKYYKHILVCEDMGCAYQTRKMPLQFTNGGPICPSCKNSNLHLEYTEANLYNQLAYFQRMFDMQKAKSTLTKDEESKINVPGETEKLYEILKLTVDKVLNCCGYGIVDLSALFQGLFEKDPNHISRNN